MTYKERIAAAQAKMDAFKAKMASAREKAKAASALKKDEVAAAFDSINTEIGEYPSKHQNEPIRPVRESSSRTR